MPYDADQIAAIDAALDALPVPTTSHDAYDAMLPYDPFMVAAAAALRAINGTHAAPTSLTDLVDVSGTPGDRKSPVYDPAGTLALLTEIFTQADIGLILTAVAETNWRPLDLADGITNNDGYVPGRYRLTLNNTVYLEGVLGCTPPLTETDTGRVVAMLPAECNPGYTLIFSVPATGQNPVELRINPDGTITYQSHFYGTGEADLVSLCGLCYSVDQGDVMAQALTLRAG